MREWLEDAFSWLIEEFGIEALRSRPVVLPSPAYFPDPYDASEEAVNRLVTQICAYMGVGRKRVDVELFSDGAPSADPRHPVQMEEYSGAAGLYQATGRKYRAIVSINESLLGDAGAVVATTAHELAHVLLLGDRRLNEKDASHELMTDLLTVFLGLGIFTANSACQFREWTDNEMTGWSTSATGYLREEEYGYAFALRAALSPESDASWKSHLNTNVRHFYRKSARYLSKRPPDYFKEYV